MTPPQEDGDIRILHVPWNVGGHAAALAAAQRRLGLNAHALALAPGGFGFQADETVLSGEHSAIAQQRARMDLLRRAVAEADVVHYSWGEPLFAPPPPGYWRSLTGPIRSRIATWAFAQLRRLRAFHDLKLLHRTGKVIAVTFLGDDLRQGGPQLRRYTHSLAHVVDYYSPEGDGWKRRIASAFTKKADILFAANPDLLHDLPSRARFLAYTTVDPSAVVPTLSMRSSTDTLKVVHAPSNRVVKGTAAVIAAVEALVARGYRIELDLVENLPNTQARSRMADADVFIDQLNAGFYGAAAVEAMALGKPVVAYIRSEDLCYLPTGMREALPVITATPATLVERLERLLISSPQELGEIGARSRRFAETWHDPLTIARETLAAYRGALARRLTSL